MESQEMQWLLDEKYGGEKSAAFFADCKRLALGEPLSYLIGFSNFLGCKIWLDSRPLIPRVETEFWTEKAIAEIKEKDPKANVLDLCAGSGCVGVAVAKALPGTSVDFSEIDADHLPTIEKNLKENKIDSDRYNIKHTNLFTDFEQKYDFILTNPPYIDASLNRVDENVQDFEPYVSLFGGEGGVEIITEIIEQARRYLSPNGQIWMEHEPEQSAAISRLAKTEGFTVTHHQDQYDVERYSVLVLQ